MINESKQMKASTSTLEGLEILPHSRSDYKDSLLGFFDRCKTSMGSRKLKSHFLSPLKDLKMIEKRHQLIEELSLDISKINELRADLLEIRDIERILAKITTKKANGGDLINLAKAFETYQVLIKNLKGFSICPILPLDNKAKKSTLELALEIKNTISDEIGASLLKGNLIRPGFNKKRDFIKKNISAH